MKNTTLTRNLFTTLLFWGGMESLIMWLNGTLLSDLCFCFLLPFRVGVNFIRNRNTYTKHTHEKTTISHSISLLEETINLFRVLPNKRVEIIFLLNLHSSNKRVILTNLGDSIVITSEFLFPTCQIAYI